MKIKFFKPTQNSHRTQWLFCFPIDKGFEYFKIKVKVDPQAIFNNPTDKMSATIITGIDAAWITSLTAYVGDLFTDLNLLIVLVIGLPLAFWVIRKTISLVRAR